MMNTRTVSIALIAAGGTALAARLPGLDTDRAEAALRAINAYGIDGIRALRWETPRMLHSLPAPDIRVVALAFSTLVVLALAIALLVQRRRARNQRTGVHAGIMQRRLTRARSLNKQGRLGIDVARETALSRDAVELLLHVNRPDEFSGSGRSYRVQRRSSSRREVPA